MYIYNDSVRNDLLTEDACKGITAKKLFEKHPELRDQLWDGHLWNPSYYVGTCGDATKDVIERYVEMQKVK